MVEVERDMYAPTQYMLKGKLKAITVRGGER